MNLTYPRKGRQY